MSFPASSRSIFALCRVTQGWRRKFWGKPCFAALAGTFVLNPMVTFAVENETVAAQPLMAVEPANKHPLPEPRRVRQPVHEYFTIFDPQSTGPQPLQQKVNPFVSYTHLGTDFGFIGETSSGIGWEVGNVSINMPDGKWAGMWHGLAGVGNALDQTLDFRACFPSFIKPKYQPKIIGVELRARGKGVIKLEIKSADQKLLWEKTFPFDTPDMRTFVENVDPEMIGEAKYLNWIAEPGTNASLDSLGFILQTPEIPFDEYVFLTSYAKLARCYSPKTGYVRDRAHLSDGAFDNVPSCGFFALASALAAKTGLVEDHFAINVIREVQQNIAKLGSARGILPHFVTRGPDGVYAILKGTEFSTVDTSIYYHAMLLAAEIMREGAVRDELVKALKEMGLDALVNGEGFISHGVRDDKITLLPAVWRDWGGETALVLGMAALNASSLPYKMQTNGLVHEGVGFIPEIQSLFYPDFDSSKPDLVSKQNWLAIRQKMLSDQQGYFPRTWPDSRAAQLGFYGLSAGEARHGLGYMVSGVGLPQQSYLHPHYVLLSACLEPDSSTAYNLLRRMEDMQLFPPWGMVENFNKEVDEYLPMQSSLNASFECISAYHLFAKSRGIPDVLYEAARSSPELRKAANVFYTNGLTSFVESKIGNPLITR